MSVFQAIVLGVVQGLTEFLPVSSSGHLIFFPAFFGWEDQGVVFDTVIHLGTLLAVLFYFRKTLLSLIRDRHLLELIIASMIPAGFVGPLWGERIEYLFRSPQVVAWSLIGWGVVLGFADWYGKRQTKDTDVQWKHAILMGVSQALALIPGTSRSGITMSAGLFSGLKREKAAEFSFLMSIPIIAAAGGAGLRHLAAAADGSVAVTPFVFGFLASAVSGFFAVKGLLRFLTKHGFLPFVVYRIIVGICILIFVV